MRRFTGIFGAGLATLALGIAPAAFAQSTDTATLSSIGVQDSGAGVVLEIGSSSRPNCGDFMIPDPPQLVFACAGMSMGSVEPVSRVGNGLIDRIEVAESSDAEGTNTEIKVFLSRSVEYDKEIAGNTLRVTLGGGGSSEQDAIAAAMSSDDGGSSSAAPDASLRLDSTRTGALSSVDGDHSYATGRTQIRGVDFQQQLDAGISRLVITGNSRLDYSTSYPSDSRMVISLRDSALGTGLERRIDTSKFASAVTGVSAFRSRQSDREVKVVVDLRESVQPTITEQGNVVLVDFPIPPSIAGAAYSAAESTETYDEPAVVEDDGSADDAPMQSAFLRERLIGAGGNQIDPAKRQNRKQDCLFGNNDCTFMGEIDSAHQWKGFPLNLNLVNANIHNVFRLISAVAKINIVTSDDVAGLVTVQLSEVPWDQALAAILQAKSLGAVQYGSVLRVAPITVIRKEREDAAAAQRAQVEALPLQVLTLPLNYASAEDVMSQVQEILSKRGSVTYDERTNSLIIRDISSSLSQIRQLVKSLDTRTPQVHIEARIVEANQAFSRSLGVQWGGNLNFSPATGAPTGLFFPNSVGLSGGRTASTVSAAQQTTGGQGTNFTTVPNYVVDLPSASQAGSLGLSLGSLTGVVGLDMRLTAGETDGSGRIVAAPSITTVTNQTATIRDGARIPYETASLRGTNVQFVEAVLLLEVTPSITADGTIFLEVSITRNRPEFGTAVRGLPTIQVKEAKTTVMVADGDTTVIGGVYTYESSIARQFVPGLGKIPVLGWLFKNSTKREDRRELLVFITPSIVKQLQ